MPHHLLKAAHITHLVETEGKHRDGGGLYLHVRAPGQASWGYRFRLGGRTLFGSIGPAKLYGLKQARDRHAAFLRILKEEKRDPRSAIVVTAPGAAVAVPVSGGAALPMGEPLAELLIRYLVKAAQLFKSGRAPLADLSAAERAKLIRDGRAGKEAKSYTGMFNRLPAAILGADAATINPLAYRAAVESVWPENAATADRMIKRLGTLLEFQRSGYVKGKATRVKHHPAMAYAEVPAYFAKLADPAATFGRQARPIGYGSTGVALRWTILTAARTEETIGATWGEIGEVDGLPVWSLTAERMKAENPHVVPLTPEMLALLGERGADDELLFKSVNGNPIDKGAMLLLLKNSLPGLTVHGFRTSFRSWAGDCTDAPREIAEKAIAHVVGGVEGAYSRGDLLTKRRKLMEQWSAYLTGRPSEAR